MRVCSVCSWAHDFKSLAGFVPFGNDFYIEIPEPGDKMFSVEHVTTDVLVLGGGLSGYRAALAAREFNLNVTIAYRARGASPFIIGFNAPLAQPGSQDSAETFFSDMIEGGYRLNDRRLAHVLAFGAERAFSDLDALGVPFARTTGQHGVVKQRHLSGNTYPRSVYVPEGTGRVVLEFLIKKARDLGVRDISGHKILSLIRINDRIHGAVLWKPGTNSFLIVEASSVVVALGGVGQLYAGSTYPVDVSSDAYGLLLDAGAKLIDMEFVQFEPVVTVWPDACAGMEMPTAMLGDGATLINAQGERFMLRYNPPLGERGIEKAKMALHIQREIDEGRGLPEGGVYFDTTVLPPTVLNSYVSHCKRLRSAGLEPSQSCPIVAPAAHSTMGGALIDENGWTGVEGLFVGGESSGGVHGASRIAGNGCTDTLVFGYVAGRSAAESSVARAHSIGGEHGESIIRNLVRCRSGEKVDIDNIKRSIRITASEVAGIWRNAEGLQSGIQKLAGLQDLLDSARIDTVTDAISVLETKNMLSTASVILQSAELRKESRGAHQRTDHPSLDDSVWLRHIGFWRDSNGNLVHDYIPVR